MKKCNFPTERCPAYITDFISLAVCYGAKGIRVTKEEESAAALETARHTDKVPTIIEFIIEQEADVWPIIPSGRGLEEMLAAEEICRLKN